MAAMPEDTVEVAHYKFLGALLSPVSRSGDGENRRRRDDSA
jgi:hypothetical protein